MRTYLFAWNPAKWPWDNLDENLAELETTGITRQMWSSKSRKSIAPGDRAFLIKLGGKRNGIVGAGYVASEPFLAKHWDGSGRLTERVLIDFEDLCNRNDDPFIPISILKTKFAEQVWSTQASGISIRPIVSTQLEKLWIECLKKIPQSNWSEEAPAHKEGKANEYLVTKYERNPYNREKCLQHYGYMCRVCETDFEKTYGEIGKGFIHVHHLNPLGLIRNVHNIDPIKDLRPVCPNCHSMIHRKKIPFTIEEIKAIYKKNTSS